MTNPAPQPNPTSSAALPRVAIHSRRYLGAKSRLLEFLEAIVHERCGDFTSFADLFGGTGVVAHRFNRPSVRVIANDLLLANTVPMRCFLTSPALDPERLETLLHTLQALDPGEDNYFSRHYGGTFFTAENARLIGAIRERIASWRAAGSIDDAFEAVLLTSLLYATDKIANTCGHYDAYRERLDQTRRLELALPLFNPEANRGNQVYQTDANRLARELEVDVVYLDPPYNSRQYSDTYHLLENLMRWEKPEVFGKARKMDRAGLKSAYCSERRASTAFADLIAHLRCRHILVSYNNMAQKGDKRSNACIPDRVILEALGARGRVEVHEQPFNPFSAGLREIEAHTERVFYCRVERAPAP